MPVCAAVVGVWYVQFVPFVVDHILQHVGTLHVEVHRLSSVVD